MDKAVCAAFGKAPLQRGAVERRHRGNPHRRDRVLHERADRRHVLRRVGPALAQHPSGGRADRRLRRRQHRGEPVDDRGRKSSAQPELEQGLPEQVRVERNAMARQLIVHMFAERERALADGAPTPHPSWDAMATSLVDAITGLMLAPVTEGGS